MPAAERDTLFVCRTCPREAWRTVRQAGDGERLAAALREAVSRSGLAGRLEILVVHCLSGCPRPCNIALSGAGRPYLRLGRLTEADIPALLELAGRYVAAPTGEEAPLPAALAGRLSLRLAPGTPGTAPA